MIMIIVTTPSKQCKSLIIVLILRQYLKNEIFCGGYEKWRRKISFFVGEEKKRRRKRRKLFGKGN